ncbi:hypothetical protein C8N24_0260 [Solirubrobacter pauli]|uniref:Phosphatidylinositol 3-/4-kinase n=1 Tax=Solirubrobacter pauli TaxID=166793 RepID=A0A660L642_9ACTN|nr:hypothetical protein C8N24_0260 [Solirubrobacter pauli]
MQWEEDPRGNGNSHDGRTIRRHMRSETDPNVMAIVKRPKPEYMPAEMYSIGMERVGYHLGTLLDLPVPKTWLDTVDGHPSSVHDFVPNARSWIQIGGAPLMRDNVTNQDTYAMAAMFDVWLANMDRRVVNFLFEPLPEGTRPGIAKGSRLWLIDHGYCGLWPAGKTVGDPAAPLIPTTLTGVLPDPQENTIAALMPAEYRMALKNSQGPDRALLLDRIRSVGDDAVDAAINEVPDDYMTPAEREATAVFLKSRRDTLDTVLISNW